MKLYSGYRKQAQGTSQGFWLSWDTVCAIRIRIYIQCSIWYKTGEYYIDVFKRTFLKKLWYTCTSINRAPHFPLLRLYLFQGYVIDYQSLLKALFVYNTTNANLREGNKMLLMEFHPDKCDIIRIRTVRLVWIGYINGISYLHSNFWQYNLTVTLNYPYAILSLMHVSLNVFGFYEH